MCLIDDCIAANEQWVKQAATAILQSPATDPDMKGWLKIFQIAIDTKRINHLVEELNGRSVNVELDINSYIVITFHRNSSTWIYCSDLPLVECIGGIEDGYRGDLEEDNDEFSS